MRKSILTFGILLITSFTSTMVLRAGNLWANSLNINYDQNEENHLGIHFKADINTCTTGTWTGLKNSNWNDPSNWCNGTLPNHTVNVIIPSGGNQPIINTSSECNNITINQGATLTIMDVNTLKVYGDWNNNGSFNANTSTVIFEGTLQQITGSNASESFYNLILSKGAIKFNVPVRIIMNLTIKDDVRCNLIANISSANTLTLGEYGQVDGEWGGNAGYPTFRNNTFFYSTATGKLIVANNTAIPGIWVGKTSSDWATASNWSDGSVPTRLTDAIITTTGSSPVINSEASCKNLFILYKSTLEIKGINILSIAQNWNNQSTFIPNFSTVIFDGAAQVIGKGPYMNLTIGGSGIKTVTDILISGILSIEGTATLSSTVSYLRTATLQYNCAVTRTIGNEWPSTQIAGIIIKNIGVIAFPFTNYLNNTPLTIFEGATLDTKNYIMGSSGAIFLQCGGELAGSKITGSSTLTLGGDVIVNNSGKGTAAAVIECPLVIPNYKFNIEAGNPNGDDPTDLLINKITSGTLTKTGSGAMSIKGDAVLNSLTINSGKFIIQPLASLKILGGLNNSIGTAGLSILSNELGTGSLITSGTTTISANVKRYMTSGAWHLVSSPVTNQTIGNFLNNNSSIPTPVGATDPRAMRAYDPVGNQWGEFYSSTTGENFTVGKGYCMRVKSSTIHEIVFTGTIQYGDKTITDLSAGNWNCIGNPYTSAIGITVAATSTANFLTMNTITNTNIDPAYCIYIWDKPDVANGQTGQYTPISNASNIQNLYYLQQGQGFMVKMSPGKNSVSFTKNMQVHQTSQALKSTDDIWPTIQLTATADSTSSSTIVAFHDGMTNGLDATYDAGLLNSGGAMELYTRLVDDYGIPFDIQALPSDQYDQLIIPVGLDYTKGGAVSFSAKGVYLSSSCRPILEDRLTGIVTDLSDKTYTTDLSASTTGTGRFYLHTSYATTRTGNCDKAPELSAWAVGNNKITINGKINNGAVASLYDLQGRLIVTHVLREGIGHRISLPAVSAGVYLLQVRGEQKVQIMKVAIGQ